MEYNYQQRFRFLSSPFNIEIANKFCGEHPNDKVLFEVKNTKGMTSSMLKQLKQNAAIRVVGGYDYKKINGINSFYNGKQEKFVKELCHNSVIYSRNELIRILMEIEKIEANINKNWSSIQKVIYVYDVLKSKIMYDPKYEKKSYDETSTLRGLITKQSVCAGFALIFKEFMDRNDIKCEYVVGGRNKTEIRHAWNIIEINQKKYPIDLTWDNATFREGNTTSFHWLGTDPIDFSSSHYPASFEETQDYHHTLSKLDLDFVKKAYSGMNLWREKDYASTTYTATRKDGTKYIIAQVGRNEYNNHTYYRYYYEELSTDGKKQAPLILYGTINLTYIIYGIAFDKPLPDGVLEVVENVYFSRENIKDSLSKKIQYLGNDVRKANKKDFVSSYREIVKPYEIAKLFSYPTKVFTRSDGSIFIAQKMSSSQNVGGINVIRYDIFEMIHQDGKSILKRNVVYTERDIFNDERQSISDEYLSRARLDRKVDEAGGYIGYYDNVAKLFATFKKIDIDSDVVSRRK